MHNVIEEYVELTALNIIVVVNAMFLNTSIEQSFVSLELAEPCTNFYNVDDHNLVDILQIINCIKFWLSWS